MGKLKFWLKKIKESALSTTPIALVIVILFFVEKFAMPEACFREELYINEIDLVGFLISVVLIIFGTTLFGIGTEQSMTDIGRYIGGSLARKKSVAFLVCMTFFLGVLVTIAEPDLTVLARQIGINYYVIVGTIGVGVGVFLVIGVLRIAYHKNLNMMFIVFYALVFVLVYLINPRFLPICFDSGGVTTGPVTVPFILGFGLGMAASHGGKNSDDSFGLTALCSVGPIISVVIIAAIMNAMGMDLPVGGAYESVTLSPNTSFADIWTSYYASLIGFSRSVALSVVPILIFFIVYELIFIRLPWQTVLRVTLGMGITYLGLVMFLSAVESGFMPIASKLGESLGTNDTFVPLAIGLGVIFGVFGVLAEPAVHVLVEQIEQVSDGAIKKLQVLIILSISIGVAVGLQLVRAYFQFDLMYYLIPGYIAAFALSFVVPKIYTAMAFDSGGVASGPMTSTFILPFCIGFSFARGEDEYLYGFGLVAMVAMMPLIVLQFMGVVSAIKTKHALRKARKRLHEADENQIVHFNFGEEEVAA